LFTPEAVNDIVNISIGYNAAGKDATNSLPKVEILGDASGSHNKSLFI
jgi:hypothetical protein